MVTQHYEHIWDCCCDHGLLGLGLLERLAEPTIHFVDINKQLIADLHSKLQTNYASGTLLNRWQTHCIDAAHIPLAAKDTPDSDHQHLIVVAGVGGERVIEIITEILLRNAEMPLDFLLCPVHHNYQVRESLVDLGLGLITEKLLQENRRFYELIHVSTRSNHPISLVGSDMWDFSRKQDRQYLQSAIDHYQRIGKNGNPKVDPIVAAYKSLQTDESFLR